MEKEKSDIDWGILKGSIILFSTCIILSSALVGGTYYFSSKLKKELTRNKGVFKSISRKYLDVDQEEKLVLDYYPKFVDLYNKGVIGREQRLNWIEALRRSGEQVKLPELRYAINSQEQFKPGYDIKYRGYQLYRSSMELQLGLLHEGDFFNLLKYLDKNVNGAYTISECKFNLNGKEVEFNKDHSNISATCMLYWITIDLKGDKRIEIG